MSKEFCHHLFESRAVVQQPVLLPCVQQCDSSLEEEKKERKNDMLYECSH